MKVLLITSRNIYNTNGEIRLIKNRANVLYNEFGIKTDFICYHDDEVYNFEQEIINKDFGFDLVTYSKKFPLSLFINKKQVVNKAKELISKNNYSAVIISGEVALPFIHNLKHEINIPFVFDIHGATDELIEFKGNSFLGTIFRKAVFKFLRRNEKKYISCFDAAFVVTEALKDHVSNSFNAKLLQYFVIPCAKKYPNLNNEYRVKKRNEYRKKYGVKDDEVLFVYSGGVSPWQCIDKTIEMFNEISKSIYNCRLLILSDQAEKINVSNSKIIKDSLPYDKVDETLCAGDYAFMIRDDLVTNHVAFPNKYCEYIASGMRIISSPFLYALADDIKKYELGYVLNNNEDIEGLIKYIEVYSNSLTDIEKRANVLKQYEFENTLIPFVDYLEGKNCD